MTIIDTPDQLITNLSTLSPNKFTIVINKFKPLAFFAQSIIIPSSSIGQNRMPTNRSKVWSTPGDTIEYDDLVIGFILDEDLKAYQQIKAWMEAIVNDPDPKDRFSDITIYLLTNNSTKNFTFTFKDTYPFTLGTIAMDTTQGEDQALTLDVTFKHTTFDIAPTL